jgi:manganese/iron transport system permease protein
MPNLCPAESALYTLLCQPLSYPFMQKAMLGALMLGIVTGILGAFVVVRGMAFFADALGHAVVPGIAVAYVIGGVTGPLLIGAMIAGSLAALVIGFITRGSRVREDTAVGIVLTGAVALGLVILKLNQKAAGHLDDLLIGNIVALETHDLTAIAVVGGLILLTIRAFYKELLLTSFDPVLGSTLRYPVEGFRYLLLIMLAMAAVIAIQAVGAVLITAMLVTPAATASLLVKRMPRLMLLSAIFCAGAGMFGVMLAWHLRLAASPSIVITLTMLFVLAWLFAPDRGMVWGIIRRPMKQEPTSGDAV